MRLYHGTTHNFLEFTTSNVGRGADQEGPGIYLSNDWDDAQFYARGNGWVFTVEADITKTVPLKGRAKKRDVIKLMRQAPDLDDTLTNWDENPHRAFLSALDAMLNQEHPHSTFQQVWYDFYLNAPDRYVQNMVALGYDGVVVPRQNNVMHVIMFDPNKIKVIDRKRIDAASDK